MQTFIQHRISRRKERYPQLLCDLSQSLCPNLPGSGPKKVEESNEPKNSDPNQQQLLNSHHISPSSDTERQSPPPSPGVQLTGGNRQVRTTDFPSLATGLPFVIAVATARGRLLDDHAKADADSAKQEALEAKKQPLFAIARRHLEYANGLAEVCGGLWGRNPQRGLSLPPCEPDVRPNSVVETTIVLQTTTGQSCRSCNSYTSKS